MATLLKEVDILRVADRADLAIRARHIRLLDVRSEERVLLVIHDAVDWPGAHWAAFILGWSPLPSIPPLRRRLRLYARP